MKPSPEPRPWPRAAAWLAFLGPFFFASYGFATWVTTQRTDVGSIVFEWERGMPFIAWTIVPYWTIDVLYALSLFVCSTRRELDAHAKRLLTAQAIAVACFLAFPLRFTFERPALDGVSGWLFDVLGQFDKPFNQAPSLHIALLVILWGRYAEHVASRWRWLLHAWFAVIGVSVLTTWQHHFVDVPTGALLGFLAMWLWPIEGGSALDSWSLADDPRRRTLALRYASGAAAAVIGASVIGGGAWWLLWIAVALAMVALAYAALGPALFQKREGFPSPGAVGLLLPYLVGARLNVWWWTRHRPAFDWVTDDVCLGRVPTARDLGGSNIAAIVDLTSELPVRASGRAYANVPLLDLVPPDREALMQAARAIETMRAHGRVLVCCALGYSRSAAAVAAWLVATGRAADVGTAIAKVESVRPHIVLGPAHRDSVASLVPGSIRTA